MITRISKKYSNWLVIGLLAFFACLMLRITLEYIPVQTDVAFLQIKQDYIDNNVWFTSFYIHVYTSMFALMAGFTQFSSSILKNNKALHRKLGYTYIIVVLFISGPASLVMSWYANGGLSSRVSFILLGIFWIYFTAQAWQRAKNRDFKSHRAYMIRSYALTLSAITLRAFKWLLASGFHFPPMEIYRTVAWAWVLNLLVAEYFIINRANKMRRPA
jgi:uncharacterized membrane protein